MKLQKRQIIHWIFFQIHFKTKCNMDELNWLAQINLNVMTEIHFMTWSSSLAGSSLWQKITYTNINHSVRVTHARLLHWLLEQTVSFVYCDKNTETTCSITSWLKLGTSVLASKYTLSLFCAKIIELNFVTFCPGFSLQWLMYTACQDLNDFRTVSCTGNYCFLIFNCLNV